MSLNKSVLAGILVGYEVWNEIGSLEGRRSWTLNMHAPIVFAQQVQYPSTHASHVKVQGDRSIRFRYMNPNMGAIVSEGNVGAYRLANMVWGGWDCGTTSVLHRPVPKHCIAVCKTRACSSKQRQPDDVV